MSHPADRIPHRPDSGCDPSSRRVHAQHRLLAAGACPRTPKTRASRLGSRSCARTGPARNRGLLATVVRRRAVDHVRQDARRRLRESRAASHPDVSPEGVVEAEDLRRHVVTKMLAMSERDRSVLLLRYYHGLEIAQVADLLSLDRRTTRTRIHRALARLRADLDPGDDRTRRQWASALGGLASMAGAPTRVMPWLAAGAVGALVLGAALTSTTRPPGPHETAEGADDRIGSAVELTTSGRPRTPGLAAPVDTLPDGKGACPRHAGRGARRRERRSWCSGVASASTSSRKRTSRCTQGAGKRSSMPTGRSI